MDNSVMSWLFPMQKDYPVCVAHWIQAYRIGQLQVVETDGTEHQTITELIVQLALRGPYNLIAVDEWLPDRDTLYRSIRRHTLNIEETLANPSIKRPMTCLQLLDLLIEADMQNKPTLLLNFLYHFYNNDVELSLRDRVLWKCCNYAKRLSLCNPVVVLVPRLNSEEYERFFSVLASVADEIITLAEQSPMEVFQGSLF